MAAEISVIIPVWNGETYVTDGLTSVFKQSFSDLEIIAINDGSTDKTAQILEQLAARELRLKVLHQPNQVQRQHAITAWTMPAENMSFFWTATIIYIPRPWKFFMTS